MILEVYWTDMIVEKQYMYIVIHRNEQLHNYHTLRYYWSNHCIMKIRANSVFKKNTCLSCTCSTPAFSRKLLLNCCFPGSAKPKTEKEKEAPERQRSIRRRIAGQTRLEGNPCVAKPRFFGAERAASASIFCAAQDEQS